MPVDFVSYLLKILNYHNYTHTRLLLQSGYSCYTFSALCKVTWIMGCNGSQKRFFCVPFGKTKLKLSSHSPLPSSRPLNHPWGYHSHSVCCLCVCVSEWAHSVFQICEILPLRVCPIAWFSCLLFWSGRRLRSWNRRGLCGVPYAESDTPLAKQSVLVVCVVSRSHHQTLFTGHVWSRQWWPRESSPSIYSV